MTDRTTPELPATLVPGDIGVRSRRGMRVEMRGLFATLPPGLVLDIPAGGGEQSAALARLGYRVVSADLFANGSGTPSWSWVRADANRTMPFRDAVFDYVLCREGIEHLEGQMAFVRECARVVKPGGKLVVTTPNVMHLSGRASAFLTGQRNLRRGLVNEVQSLRARNGTRFYHGHVFLLDYFRMRYILRVCGFDRLEVYTDSLSPTSVAMAPLVPLLWGAMKFSVAVSNRKVRPRGLRPPDPEVTRALMRDVLSPALLFGRRMIVVAERV
ncbi:MAG TPA: class I SAM-dependent methyltransferase [Candidatus Binataceae bacterium]|nr:class I SAM-dependent methyltransferase [Candidatus Binataceae bacterium]